MPWHLKILDLITDPNLVFLFFSIGLLAIGWEIFHPGAIVPGVVGAILFILALFGLSVLPFQWGGIAFMILGVGLMVAEIFVSGIGILAAGGVVSLLIGGLILFDDPGLEASTPAVVTIAVALGAGFMTIARLVVKSRGLTVTTGRATLMGAVGEVRSPVGPGGGQVFVSGELWRARAVNGSELPRGERVRVVKIDELTLTVEPEGRPPA